MDELGLVNRFMDEFDLAHREASTFLKDHPEFFQFLLSFLRDLLFNKPRDVLQYAQTFVTQMY
jgi:hypothetical protein